MSIHSKCQAFTAGMTACALSLAVTRVCASPVTVAPAAAPVSAQAMRSMKGFNRARSLRQRPMQASPRGGPDGRLRPGPKSGSRIETDRQVQQTVQAYMMVRLKEELALTPAQEEKLTPLLSESEQERFRSSAERRRLMNELQVLVNEPTTQDAAIRSRMASLHALDTAENSRRESLFVHLAVILDLRQQARMIVFMDTFPDEIRDKLKSIRRTRGNSSRDAGGPEDPLQGPPNGLPEGSNGSPGTSGRP